jgi:hypothetical protein
MLKANRANQGSRCLALGRDRCADACRDVKEGGAVGIAQPGSDSSQHAATA